MTNLEIAQLFRKVAAASIILGENRFKIIAYERVADSIEQLTEDVRDLWKENRLHDIAGVGTAIESDLGELMTSGHVKRFDDIVAKLPASIFPLLLVPGIGPKKAYKLVTNLHLTHEHTVIDELLKHANAGNIAPLDGFGEKSQADIIAAIATYKHGQIKENRMELPLADAIADDVIKHLNTLGSAIVRVNVLGSLRRKVATIGDIDIAVATRDPDRVVNHFITYPHKQVTDQGAKGATLLLHNGRQVDLRVQSPDKYGAMLQYFTGSKNHNIHLRSYALEKGLSLNEYGVKKVQTGAVTSYATEEEFYHALGLPWIAPELREDKGEIEHAIAKTLPNLIESDMIRGDVHIHTSYDLESSHDLGANSLEEYLDRAHALGYEYIGISDHNPSVSTHSTQQIINIMKKRREFYDSHHAAWIKKSKKNVKLFVMCEIDILTDGSLALPSDAFTYIDAAIVSLHSSFTQEKSVITKRVLKALLAHPKVRIFGHPTGRLLPNREGADLDWKELFAVCKDRAIALEINAYPQRLDTPDNVVFEARKHGVQFVIDTDSHAVDHMNLMKFGVSVARRGWAEKHDILNSMEYTKFDSWLKKGA